MSQNRSTSNWDYLYTATGVAALVASILVLLQYFFFGVWQLPLDGPIKVSFVLFQSNWLLTLLALEGSFLLVGRTFPEWRRTKLVLQEAQVPSKRYAR